MILAYGGLLAGWIHRRRNTQRQLVGNSHIQGDSDHTAQLAVCSYSDIASELTLIRRFRHLLQVCKAILNRLSHAVAKVLWNADLT